MANKSLATPYHSPSIMERKRWLMMEEDQCGLPRRRPGETMEGNASIL